MKPTFSQIFSDLAAAVASRSCCQRLQVGCVITSYDHRQVYAIGYNGGVAGGSDVCSGQLGSCGCLHAEINAIINCTAPRYSPKIVYVTTAPCLVCAKALVNLTGVKRVEYREEYRSRNGVDLLQQLGIEVKYVPI